MTAGPTVTCVIPVHDGERYLAEAIDSVLSQVPPVLELIVVDNGSRDGSASLAEAYGPPVVVVRQANLGPPGGRNTGIRLAQGDLIAFLDADDTFVPGKLARQLERFAARPDLEISLGMAENFWEPGLEDEERRYRENGKVLASHVFGTMLARRSVFDRIGLIDETLPFGDQVEFFGRVADHGLVVEVLPDVLQRRRMHATSLSHAQNRMEPYLDLVKRRLDARRAREA